MITIEVDIGERERNIATEKVRRTKAYIEICYKNSNMWDYYYRLRLVDVSFIIDCNDSPFLLSLLSPK